MFIPLKTCVYCKNDEKIERIAEGDVAIYTCGKCSASWTMRSKNVELPYEATTSENLEIMEVQEFTKL